MAIRLPSPIFALAAALLLAAVTLLAAGAVRADHKDADGSHADGAHAQSSTPEIVLYESGVHYEELLVPVATADASKVEVAEMFSYLCIHCFNFDAAVSEWAKRQDDGVLFTRVPAIFNKTWRLFAQAYYTSEALGVSDKTHDALFEAVHTYKEDLRTPKAIAALFKRVAEVDEATFMKAFESFSVGSKVQQANSRAGQVRLSSVPTLVVNGKYKTNSTMAGTNIGMLQVVDFLIKKEQAAASAKAAAASE